MPCNAAKATKQIWISEKIHNHIMKDAKANRQTMKVVAEEVIAQGYGYNSAEAMLASIGTDEASEPLPNEASVV